ncbi:hypothetical protein RJ640_016291 [Escallonia rubra]|uniref:Uncharacterized protein n=1 Tax=Escallonia rubra TaxID=112253 RepID=A0AA88UMX9_9ASTE|nr:hypothetical protein RJ640_016291 [Escallonia rubra]
MDVTWPSLQLMPYQPWGHPSDAKEVEFHDSRTRPDGSFWIPFLISKSASKSGFPVANSTNNNIIQHMDCIPPSPTPKPHEREKGGSRRKEPIMVLPGSIAAVAFLLITLSAPLICLGIRSFPARTELGSDGSFGFAEAPEYRNGVDCPVVNGGSGKGVGTTSCDASLVHVAMTLDSEYLRGSMAAVHSVLRHTSCPENLFFHLIAAEFDPVSPRVLTQLVRSTFPSLSFKIYIPSD